MIESRGSQDPIKDPTLLTYNATVMIGIFFFLTLSSDYFVTNPFLNLAPFNVSNYVAVFPSLGPIIESEIQSEKEKADLYTGRSGQILLSISMIFPFATSSVLIISGIRAGLRKWIAVAGTLYLMAVLVALYIISVLIIR